MQVLKAGKTFEAWSVEETCTGDGNGMEGCEAVLLVEQEDIFLTYGEGANPSSYVTFKCPGCDTLTDLMDQQHFPQRIRQNLPNQADWEADEY